MKAIITDLDGTLWSGILSEGGIGEFNHDYYLLLRELLKEGILVGVATKNKYSDISSTVPSLFDYFYPIVANWDPKSLSVRKIIKVWNIQPEDVLFIDDNVLEVKDVQNNFPKMITWLFDKDNIPYDVKNIRKLFLKKEINTEDKLRMESIKNGVRFNRELGSSDPEEFFKNLEAKITIRNEWTPRALELINKTNQFSINGKRMTEATFNFLQELDDTFCYTFEYADKFGSLGVIGVIIGIALGQKVRIFFFCLSCRAFGRRVEYAMLNHLQREFHLFDWEEKQTEKNQMAIDFLNNIIIPKIYHNIDNLCTK